ncbi:hypothetical protein EUX98_g4043 [Antrodiella citrinella]|uniref:Uncharacterized protein n=1 Tax=Antrodiella citrinella TaxID=2447956 RepID=A0A4S4N343_9APHY|nr:hypothetical protein EUX98_g4043 [Antrodiella citrinella]
MSRGVYRIPFNIIPYSKSSEEQFLRFRRPGRLVILHAIRLSCNPSRIVAQRSPQVTSPALASNAPSYVFFREDNTLKNLGPSGALSGGINRLLRSYGIKRAEMAAILVKEFELDKRMSMTMDGMSMGPDGMSMSPLPGDDSSDSSDSFDIGISSDGTITQNGEKLCACGSGDKSKSHHRSTSSSSSTPSASASANARRDLVMSGMSMGPNGMSMSFPTPSAAAAQPNSTPNSYGSKSHDGMSMGPDGMSMSFRSLQPFSLAAHPNLRTQSLTTVILLPLLLIITNLKAVTVRSSINHQVATTRSSISLQTGSSRSSVKVDRVNKASTKAAISTIWTRSPFTVSFLT